MWEIFQTPENILKNTMNISVSYTQDKQILICNYPDLDFLKE